MNGELLETCLATQAALLMCNADKARIREQPLPVPSEQPTKKKKSWFGE